MQVLEENSLPVDRPPLLDAWVVVVVVLPFTGDVVPPESAGLPSAFVGVGAVAVVVGGGGVVVVAPPP